MIACEIAAEMLSALQDGELDPEERFLLADHLRSCEECRTLQDRFAAVDRLAAGCNTLPSPDFAGRVAASLERSAWPGLRWIIRMAAAAVILIAISLVVLVTSDQAGANGVAAHISALEEMNSQAVMSQDTVLKAIEWDLNAMKLTVRCTDLDEQKMRTLLAKIDGLLGEVERVQQDNPHPEGEK